jgi:hypothetical protein
MSKKVSCRPSLDSCYVASAIVAIVAIVAVVVNLATYADSFQPGCAFCHRRVHESPHFLISSTSPGSISEQSFMTASDNALLDRHGR